MPDYALIELRKWMFSQKNFEEIYNNWIKNDYKKDLIPSCDRLDNSNPYTLKNLRLGTWNQNKQNYIKTISKKVNKYDLNMNYICTYNSLHEAGSFCGYHYQNIQSCCTGRTKTAYNYIWKYKN